MAQKIGFSVKEPDLKILLDVCDCCEEGFEHGKVRYRDSFKKYFCPKCYKEINSYRKENPKAKKFNDIHLDNDRTKNWNLIYCGNPFNCGHTRKYPGRK